MPRRVVAVALCALACAASARAATTTTGKTFATVPSAPVYDGKGHLIQTPFTPTARQPHLTKQQALADFVADHKVADWLKRYPKKGRTDDETFNAKDNSWKVGVWWKQAGEIEAATRTNVIGVAADVSNPGDVSRLVAAGIERFTQQESFGCQSWANTPIRECVFFYTFHSQDGTFSAGLG